MKLGMYVLALFTAVSAQATPCSVKSTVGETCDVAIARLLPTQFALGMREVDERASKLSGMGSGKLDKYVNANPAIVVIGPRGDVYIVDHQHLARALQDVGVKTMLAEVKDNLSSLSDTDFWKEMEGRRWVRLLNERGEGPLTHDLLPTSIKQMKNDPYRSLAWAVRKQGGYDKTDVFFADFLWADFFRTRIVIGSADKAFDQALDEALILAHDSAAKNLPGWKKP